MKLLGVDRSPYARKVRIVLEEKHIPYEYVQARPSTADSPVPQFNPLAKIPVLVTSKGKGIYDSRVIVEYLEALAPDPRLIPDDIDERADVKGWEALGDGITDATVLISHDYDKIQSAEWHAKQRLKIDRGLAWMEKALGTREFCHGNRFSLADIAAGYALAYVDGSLPAIDWRTSHPGLAKLAERLAQRDSFRKTVPQV
ncbi:MAG TPA: glutathione S-transferase N-terminal domain-containing protein [Burkholderiales bacterium]|jgi:glutathione S-transferase|nr:glutathione S-transferase N-terminal domain-containing protein [Burkholderiales bacterium]